MHAHIIMIMQDFNNFHYHKNNYVVTHSEEKTFNSTLNELKRIRFFSPRGSYWMNETFL